MSLLQMQQRLQNALTDVGYAAPQTTGKFHGLEILTIPARMTTVMEKHHSL
jgi:hypothetical protein